MNNKKKDNFIHEAPMTYEDYANLNDGKRYELVDGVLELMSPAPSPDHQSISKEIFKHFSSTCEDNYVIFYAPIDLILSETMVRQPDLLLIHRKRFNAIVKKRGIVGPPDLVIEILSPNSVKRDKESKTRDYSRFGIPEYWIVDPQNHCIEQYLLEKGIYSIPTIYVGGEPIKSRNITCAHFSMNDIMAGVMKTPEE